ncbi:MAG: hydrogen gas-evolving membrane-bound hydrogenase subunit E [Alkalispirochaeta sp.]|jgi:multicomponent Na+:H+ antiporter subunit B
MVRRLVEIGAVGIVALFLFAALVGEHPEGTPLRDYVIERGEEETGASNLVTSIYLGYRAFDTLGETVVLLLAVSGVIFLVEKRPGETKDAERKR